MEGGATVGKGCGGGADGELSQSSTGMRETWAKTEAEGVNGGGVYAQKGSEFRI